MSLTSAFKCVAVAAVALLIVSVSAKKHSGPAEYWKAFLNVSYLDTERNVWHTERAETGRYSSGNNNDVSGVVIEMETVEPFEESSVRGDDVYTGCYPPFKANYPENEPWIALVRRGKCTFNHKIRNALKLNASGVLIYDNEQEGKVLQAMVVEQFPIPSVFTYNWKGLEIANLIRKYGRVVLRLHKGSRCRTTAAYEGTNLSLYSCIPLDEWQDFQNLLMKTQGNWNWNITGIRSGAFDPEKRTSVLFVSVSFMILMLISLAWLVFYYIQRFRYIHAKDQMERKLCSQAKRALAIISTNVVKKDDLDQRDFADTCAVCIETCKLRCFFLIEKRRFLTNF